VPALKQAITLLRGYGVRVALFVQSIAQLRAVWPRDHETVLANCGTWLTFGHGSLTAARQVAEQLGDIGAEALFALQPDQLALHRAGRPTELALKLDYLQDPLFAGRFDANPLHAAPLPPLRGGLARRPVGAAAELSRLD
jgi:type IV secretion system protein VirD4